MPQINVGLLPDDGTGDTLRQAGLKINQWGQLGDKTVNAAFYKTPAITIDAALNLAIPAAAALGSGAAVWIPNSMLPYTTSLVTFNPLVRMIREGGNPTVYDVRAYGAAGDGGTDDTLAINTAITHSLTGNGGPVFIPPMSGDYAFTQILLRSGTMLLGGTSGLGSDTIVGVVKLKQISGTALPMTARADTGANLRYCRIVDINFDASGNSSNAGGVLFEEAVGCECTRVEINNAKLFGFAIKGTAAARGAAFNKFLDCRTTQQVSPAVGILIDAGFSGAYCTANTIERHIHESLDATFLKVNWAAGQSQPDGTVAFCQLNFGASHTLWDINGAYWRIIGNRSETTGGGAVCTVTLATAGSAVQPCGFFLANQITAPGGIVWNDAGSMLSPRLDVQGSGTTVMVRRFTIGVVIGLAYGATVNTDASACNAFRLDVTNGTAFTIANPTNGQDGDTLTYNIQNRSGGAMGVITWGANFRLAGAFTNPANNNNRNITFLRESAVYRELSRSAADQAD